MDASRYSGPIVAVVVSGALVAFGFLMRQTGVIGGLFASPFVLATAIVALTYGRTAAVMSALIGIGAFHCWGLGNDALLEWPRNEEWMAHATLLVTAIILPRYSISADCNDAAPYHGPLPFAAVGTERNWWSVEASGEWQYDCRVGAEYARLYAERMSKGNAPPLAWIVRDMVQAGRYTGVEAGFVSAISQGLTTAASCSHDNPGNRHWHGRIVHADSQVVPLAVSDHEAGADELPQHKNGRS